MLMTGSPSWICFAIHRVETESPRRSLFHRPLRAWYTCTNRCPALMQCVCVRACWCVWEKELVCITYRSSVSVQFGDGFQQRANGCLHTMLQHFPLFTWISGIQLHCWSITFIVKGEKKKLTIIHSIKRCTRNLKLELTTCSMLRC